MARGGSRPNSGRPKGAVNRATAKARIEAEKSGILPLDFMLKIMRDERADRAERLDMAKAAAPYVHARLAAVTVGGDDDADPIRHVFRWKDD